MKVLPTFEHFVNEAARPSVNLQGNKDKNSAVIVMFFNSKDQKSNSSMLWNDVIGLINANQGKLEDYTVTDSGVEFEVIKRSNIDGFIKQMNIDIPKNIKGYTSFEIYKV
jgi:hypothetical protein